MARQPLSNTYSVEVSGWDDSLTFFVERTELFWKEETDKFLTLSRLLCPGTRIFVRLLQPTAVERSFPAAYQAEAAVTTPEGKNQFRIKRCEPQRRGARRSAAAISTADTEEALGLIKRGRCRLALVDVHMPGMDGYEFLDRALRSAISSFRTSYFATESS